MRDSKSANMYRSMANKSEAMADKWLAFAKNKAHHKSLRISAARQYRNNKRRATEYRMLADKYS